VGRIDFFFEDVARIRVKQDFLRSVIRGIAENENRETGPVNVVFCSDAYLLQINIDFLAHDYYTDIITFDNGTAQLIAGELYISIDRIKENSLLYGVSFRMELARVVIHGILHLAGYKDKSPGDKKKMKQKEDFYLRRFDVETRY
jgi:rRNA maturation RNase YbeY